MKVPLVVPLALLIFNTNIAFGMEGSCKPTKHAKLPSITELSYHKARRALLSAGWQPLQTKPFNGAESDPDISFGNGAVFWEKGYVEVEACSGMGMAPCAFLFKDAYGNRLRVTTAGEEYPKGKAFAKVTGFQFVCMP